jgi:hypothetical protein
MNAREGGNATPDSLSSCVTYSTDPTREFSYSFNLPGLVSFYICRFLSPAGRRTILVRRPFFCWLEAKVDRNKHRNLCLELRG